MFLMKWDSIKWEFDQQIAKLSVKWEVVGKKLVKRQGFRDQNADLSGNGNCKKFEKPCYFFAVKLDFDKMGFWTKLLAISLKMGSHFIENRL